MLATLRRTQLKWLIIAEMVGWPVDYSEIVYVYSDRRQTAVAWVEVGDVTVQVMLQQYQVGPCAFLMGWAPGVIVVMLG
jgi:hypothetical protein